MASGQKFEMIPEGTPVLAGQTRTLPLVVKPEEGKPPVEFRLPLKTRGTLEWEKGGFKVEAEFQ